MDPNATWAALVDLAKRFNTECHANQDAWMYAQRMRDHIFFLEEWLAKGGFKPDVLKVPEAKAAE